MRHWLLLASLLFTLPASGGVINVHQLNLNLDGNVATHSDWGSVDVSFDRSTTLKYVNFSINGSWQVQNMAVSGIPGTGDQEVTFNFFIGATGTDWTGSALIGYSFDDVPSGIPAGSALMVVTPRTVTVFAGDTGGGAAPTPAAPAVGDEVVTSYSASADFPNQEVGEGECVPGAISNSLQYLKNRGMPVNGADITVAKMKDATGWAAGGAPVGWWDTKKKYMADNGYPVDTSTTGDPDKAGQALDNGDDVELRVPGHAAAVVGIKKLANGKYEITVAHDTDQGNAGGTKTEAGIYDPGTGLITGITWMDGKKLDRFVVEVWSPEPPASLLIGLPLAAVWFIRRRRRPCYHTKTYELE
ncbi:MAG: hypothetical protein NTY38_29585 [Acidobacteria bacterium]|nr:hypothetical protein [Acidobacteriota bacterium]